MTRDEIRQTLRSFILANFLAGEAPETLQDTTLLVSSGVITSLSMVELVTFIEDEFHLTLEPDDLRVSRMDTLELLTELVARRMGAAPGSTDPSE